MILGKRLKLKVDFAEEVEHDFSGISKEKVMGF